MMIAKLGGIFGAAYAIESPAHIDSDRDPGREGHRGEWSAGEALRCAGGRGEQPEEEQRADCLGG